MRYVPSKIDATAPNVSSENFNALILQCVDDPPDLLLSILTREMLVMTILQNCETADGDVYEGEQDDEDEEGAFSASLRAQSMFDVRTKELTAHEEET